MLIQMAFRVAATVLLIVVLSSCGSGVQIDDEVVAVAAQNAAVLGLSDDVATTGLLDGVTGEITSLGDVVTGDRAVLVWYWAPN